LRDILPDLDRWMEAHRPVALATVVQTWGSSPRRAGAKMACTADGGITGSVSGGCVENAVIAAGLDGLKSDRPQLLHFGVADETAWEVGLACGGSIDIFVNPLDAAHFQRLRSALNDETSAVAFTVIRGSQDALGRELLAREDGSSTGTLGGDLDAQALSLFDEILARGECQRILLDDATEVFAEPVSPPLTLVIVGGAHISIALASLAKTLGYRTVVVDPRRAWGNAGRFPDVDRLIQSWPEEAFQDLHLGASTAVAMLTHDPKLDDPALKIALSSPAFYVGALGSRGTQVKRRARLMEAGLTEAHLSRLHAPIGLDIEAGTPEEIALSIMAEVVESYRKRNQAEVRPDAVLHP
jgi:xanthine dehydrogenase accessory factor